MQVYRGGLDVVVNILVLHGMNRPGVNESVRENFEQLFNDAQLKCNTSIFTTTSNPPLYTCIVI